MQTLEYTQSRFECANPWTGSGVALLGIIYILFCIQQSVVIAEIYTAVMVKANTNTRSPLVHRQTVRGHVGNESV